MIERSPSLFFAAVLALIGVLLVALIMGNADRWSFPVIMGLAFAAGVCFLYAGLTTLAWSSDVIGGRWMYLFERARRAMATTRESVMLETYARMSPEQLAAWEYSRTSWVRVVDFTGSKFVCEFSFDGQTHRVPEAFLMQYFNGSTDEHTLPIGTFSEGSKERDWTSSITRYLMHYKYAEKWRGNEAARFTPDKQTAMTRFGLQESEV